MKTINFHILEDKANGFSEVYMVNYDSLVAQGIDEEKLSQVLPTLAGTNEVRHILTLLTVDFYVLAKDIQHDFDPEVDHYVLYKESLEPSDYYTAIQNFLSERCDFYERKYTIYLKLSLT
jgi:hypothetical protein